MLSEENLDEFEKKDELCNETFDHNEKANRIRLQASVNSRNYRNRKNNKNLSLNQALENLLSNDSPVASNKNSHNLNMNFEIGN